MSYSFSIVATSKADAKQQITDQFANVVPAQASHAIDQAAAVACGHAFVDILKEPAEGEEISVSMYGSLGWNHSAPTEFLSGNVSVTAGLRARKT